MDHRIDLPLMSVTMVARCLRITPDAVIMLVKKGDLPSLVKVENRKMFERNEIEEWKRKNHV